MNKSTLLVLSLLLVIASQRRINHLAERRALHSHLDIDLGDAEKRIFKDVLTNTEVTQAIVDGKTATPEFKKLVLKKTLVTIGSNEEYLKPLSKKIFENSNIRITDEDKLKVLGLALKDDALVNLVADGKNETQIVKRVSELLNNDQQLLKNLGNSAFKDNDLGKELNEQQRASLLKILINNPNAIKKGKISDDDVKNIINQIEKDNDLKDFYALHKSDFTDKLIRAP